MVKSHYQNLLSQHYTWTFGDPDEKYHQNLKLISKFLRPGNLRAVELGCGSGFQTIPLLKLGYTVVAIDSSPFLLDELKEAVKRLKCDAEKLINVEGDLLSFSQYCKDGADAIICMGDTITHLASLQEIEMVFKQSSERLLANGKLIVQFRDLTKPLRDTDRFIPVKSDERTVFTCFLEWIEKGSEPDNSGCIIKVHDLVHVKKGVGAWELCTSFYNKLGITAECLIAIAMRNNLNVVESSLDSTGMVLICFSKPVSTQ